MNVKEQIQGWVNEIQLPIYPFDDLQSFEREWSEFVGEGVSEGVKPFGEVLICKGVWIEDGVRFKAMIDPNTRGVNVLFSDYVQDDKNDI